MVGREREGMSENSIDALHQSFGRIALPDQASKRTSRFGDAPSPKTELSRGRKHHRWEYHWRSEVHHDPLARYLMPMIRWSDQEDRLFRAHHGAPRRREQHDHECSTDSPHLVDAVPLPSVGDGNLSRRCACAAKEQAILQ